MGQAGSTITYDESGNPLTYYNGTSFSWHGTELYRATVGADNYYFTYNSSGYRASKRVGNEITYYYYEGSLLVAEVTGERVVRYIYDAGGSPIGFMYRDADSAATEWESFFYEKNLQGDILAIYTKHGALAVEYTYDAWGNSTETAVISNSNALYNSLRYRGYFYDEDLSLYYLLSRYYDANTGRFISPDDVSYLGANGDLSSYNLYAYCSNNPQWNYRTAASCKQIVTSYKKSVSEFSNSIESSVAGYDMELDFDDPKIHWDNKWFDTDWPSFFQFTEDGVELVGWDMTIYKGELTFAQDENNNVHVSGGNAGIYAGINPKKGIGVEVGASVVDIGYEGKYFGVSFEILTAQSSFMYKDGKFRSGSGFGWFGVSFYIDFANIYAVFSGG